MLNLQENFIEFNICKRLFKYFIQKNVEFVFKSYLKI